MESITVALFGEAEKGDFQTPYFCKTLPDLVEYLGNPPPNSHGLYCAVQALMYHHNLIFLRVREEGFSYSDYLTGLKLLETQDLIAHIAALCLPGVGDTKIFEVVIPFCISHHSVMVTSEADLYDYLTNV